jgi:cytochrome c nitrite reductase small subunit
LGQPFHSAPATRQSGRRLRAGSQRASPGLSLFGIVFAVCLGLLTGVGTFTFRYAEGFSYFSADSRSCANCHIMNDQYASWSRGPHHAAAGCVDCHLPHEFVPKYIAKAENGYHHSKAFTLQDFHEPIMIKPKNAGILQESCIRCHGDFVHELVRGSTTAENAVQCVHCHRGVGHGPRAWGR